VLLRSASSRDDVWRPIGAREVPPHLFFHIQKTGGSSVVESAIAVLGKGAVFEFDDVEPRRIVGRLQRLTAPPAPFRLLYGHLSPLVVPLGVPIKRAIVLRDPLERVVSHFRYVYLHRHRGIQQSEFFLQRRRIGRRQFDVQDLTE